jgi:Zn-dependent M28 family amino/carboxypeptidase
MLPYLHHSVHRVAPPTAAQSQLADELKRDVVMLATEIGPRGVFAPQAYRTAEVFLTTALTRAGFGVRRETWTTHRVECANLEVVLTGTKRPDRVLVVGAHYDSMPGCPAANDNASGVAGVLAIARRLAARPRNCTVRLVLFANEEPPFFNIDEMGSQLYARAAKKAGDDILGMFCLETIGCYSDAPDSQGWPVQIPLITLPDKGDFIALVGPSSAAGFIRRCTQVFDRRAAFSVLGAAVPLIISEQVNWSDHRGFNAVGYPAFMVTDTAPLRYAHYHLETDTPEKLDYVSMARVVEGMLGVVEEIADEG